MTAPVDLHMVLQATSSESRSPTVQPPPCTLSISLAKARPFGDHGNVILNNDCSLRALHVWGVDANLVRPSSIARYGKLLDGEPDRRAVIPRKLHLAKFLRGAY